MDFSWRSLNTHQPPRPVRLSHPPSHLSVTPSRNNLTIDLVRELTSLQGLSIDEFNDEYFHNSEYRTSSTMDSQDIFNLFGNQAGTSATATASGTTTTGGITSSIWNRPSNATNGVVVGEIGLGSDPFTTGSTRSRPLSMPTMGNSQFRPGPGAENVLRVQVDQQALNDSFAYYYDRGNGRVTRLIPADMLPPLRDIPRDEDPAPGMIIVSQPAGMPPSGRSSNSQRVELIAPVRVSLLRDDVQSRIDNIVNNQASPSSALGPARRTKVYCDKWVHEGICAFTQQGCRFKHEMPLDRETQHSLGLFHGLPAWYRKQQAEAARERVLEEDEDLDRPIAITSNVDYRVSRGNGGVVPARAAAVGAPATSRGALRVVSAPAAAGARAAPVAGWRRLGPQPAAQNAGHSSAARAVTGPAALETAMAQLMTMERRYVRTSADRAPPADSNGFLARYTGSHGPVARPARAQDLGAITPPPRDSRNEESNGSDSSASDGAGGRVEGEAETN